MTRRITRRAAAKLVLSASAALALPNPAAGDPADRTSPKIALSLKERKLLAKSIVQLRSAAHKIREMKIPMGTEPAFQFRPLLRSAKYFMFRVRPRSIRMASSRLVILPHR